SRVTPMLSDSYPILLLQVKGPALSALLMSTGMRKQLQKEYKPQLDGQKDTTNPLPLLIQKTQKHPQNRLPHLQQLTWENHHHHHQSPSQTLNSQVKP